MLIELEKIYANFENAIDRAIAFLKSYEEIKALDFNYMYRSKYYNNVNKRIEKIRSNLSKTQSIKYNAIIISLYGCYELTIKQFINEIIHIMLDNNIGDILRLKNENLSNVIKNIERRSLEDKSALINGLHLLFNENDISGYNFDLSLNNYQNIKTNIAYDMAKMVGINDMKQQIRKHPFVIKFIMEQKCLPDWDTTLKYINSGVAIFSEIDDLVNSRNKIAHEGFEPAMISDEIIVNSLIPKLKLFVLTYMRALQLHILESYEKRGSNLVKINILRNIINNNIICFNTGNCQIDKNTYILVTSPEKKILAKIINLEINNVDVNNADPYTNVGCQLDINVKDSNTFQIFIDEK